MVQGIIDTINPKGGHGMAESIIVVLIVIAVLAMAICEIPVPEVVSNAFTAVIAYLVGTNAKRKQWSEDERKKKELEEKEGEEIE